MDNVDNYLKDNIKNIINACDGVCSRECLKLELAILQLVLASQRQPVAELQLPKVLAVLEEVTKKIAQHHSDHLPLYRDILPIPAGPEREPPAPLPA